MSPGPVLTRLPRICVSSASGGGGKTFLTLGLGRAMTRRGISVKPFKKGPDYIDAAWLSLACGKPCTNLDPFFMAPDELRDLFVCSMRKASQSDAENAGALALVEGNRGLYDGLDETGSCSTAVVARALACPVLLCLDCRKTTRTVAAILHGLQSFESGLNFCGVILNKTGSSRHEASLRKAIEADTDFAVLGALPRLDINPLPERHMGLASKGATLGAGAQATLDRLADAVASHCDLDAIMQAAKAAPPLAKPGSPQFHSLAMPADTNNSSADPPDSPKIGYVCDDALWFYYPENLEALKDAGAQLVKLSLLDTNKNNLEAWENIAGLYLGGGFPEDMAEGLSRSPCLEIIRRHAGAGLPIYAECGGLIILLKGLRHNNIFWPMCGIFPAMAEWHSKPRGLGYVEARVIAKNPFFPLGMTIRGHEFHYSGCVFNEMQTFALQLKRGSGLCRQSDGSRMDGFVLKNILASYMHIFAPSVSCWAPNFVSAAKKRKRKIDKL